MNIEELKIKLENLASGLTEKKTELAELLATEASLEGNEEAIAAFEEKTATLISEIDTLNALANKEYEKFKALNPVSFNLNIGESKSVSGVDTTGLEELLNSFAIKTSAGTNNKKTIGTMIGEYVSNLGVKNEEDFNRTFTRDVRFVFQLSENDAQAEAEVKSMQNIKTLYANNGVELLNASVPVPGFQGYGCTVYEVADECRLCIQPNTFKDCLTVRTMPAGSVVQYDFPVSRDDNAAAVRDHVTNPYPTVIQNGKKPESLFTYNTAKVNVSKIAHWIDATDDVLDDCSKMADRIDFHLQTGLMQELDRQLIAGSGINGELLGLLQQPGRLTLNGTTITTGITSPNIYDKLYAAKLQLEQNCAKVDCVMINPLDRAKVALAKDSQGNYLFPQANCDVESVGCLMLKTSPDIPVGTAIIGEFKNNWIWYVRKNLEVRVGMKGEDFINNVKTFLAEVRGASVVLCPQKLATVTNI